MCILGTNSQLSLTASLVVLPSNLTSPFVSCPDSDVAMTPYLTSIPLFDVANCFQTSRTHPVGLLCFLDCNRSITLDIISATMPCSSEHVNFLCHSGTLSHTSQLVRSLYIGTPFPELGIIQGNKPLPVPVVDMIAAQHKKAVQVVPLLVATGIAMGAGIGIAGITTSMTQYLHLLPSLKVIFRKWLKLCFLFRNRSILW